MPCSGASLNLCLKSQRNWGIITLGHLAQMSAQAWASCLSGQTFPGWEAAIPRSLPQITKLTFITMGSRIAVVPWSFIKSNLCCYSAYSNWSWWELKLYLKCEGKKVSKQSVNPSRTAHGSIYNAAKSFRLKKWRAHGKEFNKLKGLWGDVNTSSVQCRQKENTSSSWKING